MINMKSSRVLHLYRRFMPDYTGDGIYYSRLVPLMEKHGTHHLVLATETDVPTSPAQQAGITVHYLTRELGADARFALQRWIWKNADSFDILHIHSHVSWRFSAYLLARLLGKAVIFSSSLEDSPGDLLLSYRRASRFIASVLMHSVQVFVAISPRLYLMSLKATSPERVCNIPQGVQDTYAGAPLLQVRQQVRQQWNLADDDILMLNVGSICDRKNTLFLVEVLARVANPKVKLLIVGPELEPDYARRVDELIARHALTDRVIKVGFASQPDLYYKSCDILAFSSKSEGFSNVYLEAMCHALPVVTLYLPGLVDHLFEYGQTGFFSRDVDTFVSHVELLAADPQLRQKMGQQARAYVLKHYSLEYIARLYVDLYQRFNKGSAQPSDSAPVDKRPAIVDCSMVGRRPGAFWFSDIAVRHDMAPILNIVIDTEAEFDWDKGIADDSGRVSAISELPRVVDLLSARDAHPCLVIDYPVATVETSQYVIAALAKQGAELGVHLQPWSSPPFAEPVDSWHSFSGNLGPMFEKAKLLQHKQQVALLTDSAVRAFKAGRYGASASTFEVLAEVGMDIDLSISSGFNFSSEGGPDWRRFGNSVGWVGRDGGILELPTTAGYSGPASWLMPEPPAAPWLLVAMKQVRLAHAQRLSPEGASLRDLVRLTKSLHAGGLRVFTLSFHSPSLKAGCTPYTRHAADVAAFIKTITDYVDFFKNEMGGQSMTPTQIRSGIESGQWSRRVT